MPKTDFNKIIEHDQLYWNTLNELFEFSVIKADILGEKSSKVLKTQTRETIIENIDLLVEWAKTKVDCLDMKGKLKIQEILIKDKVTHFENVFLPQFNKEVKESKENFSETFKLCESHIEKYADKDLDGRIVSVITKIGYELRWWSKTSAEDKKNEEFVIQIYKPLKRLNSALEKALKEVKQEEKYKV
jgi:hypothetical protein